MAKIVLFNKPYGVLSQFSDAESRATLKDYINLDRYYPAGRLDKDSEGLLILTNDGQLQHKIANPSQKMGKTYWVQVEGLITKEAIYTLSNGVYLKDGLTKPAQVKKIVHPNIWSRTPPIRFRKTVPDSWVEIKIYEGKNRQVRRMFANVGFPCLRLIRNQIGPWCLNDLLPGDYRLISIN